MKKNPGMGFKNGKKRGEWAELVFAMRATELGLLHGAGPWVVPRIEACAEEGFAGGLTGGGGDSHFWQKTREVGNAPLAAGGEDSLMRW